MIKYVKIFAAGIFVIAAVFVIYGSFLQVYRTLPGHEWKLVTAIKLQYPCSLYSSLVVVCICNEG